MSRPELDSLLNSLLPFAQQMLQKHGEFYPFGVTMRPDGAIESLAAQVGEERPLSQTVIDMLIESYREQALAGEIIATGIGIDVRSVSAAGGERTDAILARLEHKDGEAIEVYLPYRKGLFGRLKYGEIFAAPGVAQVFATHAV